jgi:hypothetical protein
MRPRLIHPSTGNAWAHGAVGRVLVSDNKSREPQDVRGLHETAAQGRGGTGRRSEPSQHVPRGPLRWLAPPDVSTPRRPGCRQWAGIAVLAAGPAAREGWAAGWCAGAGAAGLIGIAPDQRGHHRRHGRPDAPKTIRNVRGYRPSCIQLPLHRWPSPPMCRN